MKNFIKSNIGFLIVYIVLIGGGILINVRFSEIDNNTNQIIALNK